VNLEVIFFSLANYHLHVADHRGDEGHINGRHASRVTSVKCSHHSWHESVMVMGRDGVK